jgi:hypothetical protein
MVKTSGNPDSRSDRYKQVKVADPYTGEVWETQKRSAKGLFARLLRKERPSGFPTFESEMKLRKKYGKNWWAHRDEAKEFDG